MAISRDSIFQAAEQIAASGVEPTLNEVRKAVGGGSFTTISDAMKDWRASRQAAAPAPVQQTAPEEVSQRMLAAAADIWSIARTMASEQLETERTALKQAGVELENARKEAADLADAVAADLEKANGEVERLAGALAESSAQVVSALGAAEGLRGEVRAHETEISSLKEQLGAAQGRGEELLRKESMSRGEAENLRRDVDSLQTQLKEARAEAKLNQNNFLGAERRAMTASAQADERRQRIESLEKTIDDYEADLSRAKGALSDSQRDCAVAQAVVEERTKMIDVLQSEVDALRTAAVADKGDVGS